MAIFDGAIFDANIFDTGDFVSDAQQSGPYGRKRKHRDDDDLVRQVIEKWEDIESRRAPVIAPPAHVLIPKRIEPVAPRSSRELLTLLMLAEIDD